MTCLLLTTIDTIWVGLTSLVHRVKCRKYHTYEVSCVLKRRFGTLPPFATLLTALPPSRSVCLSICQTRQLVDTSSFQHTVASGRNCQEVTWHVGCYLRGCDRRVRGKERPMKKCPLCNATVWKTKSGNVICETGHIGTPTRKS